MNILLNIEQALPPRLLSLLRRLYYAAKLFLLVLVSSSRVCAAPYYGFISSAYRREQMAVMAGIVRHLAQENHDTLIFRLRRNVHRIEKGLLMPQRKEIFAVDYIAETVNCYKQARALPTNAKCQGELSWAHDVLSLYFSVVKNHPVVAAANISFLTVEKEPDQHKVPYKRSLDPAALCYDSLLQLAKYRRSVRSFQQKPVPHEIIDQALHVAQLSPSACNRQPFSYRFFDESKTLRQLASMPFGTAGFAENIPCIAAVIGDFSAIFHERERHTIYIDASLSVMSFLFGLEALGVSSCPLNWPDISILDKKISKLLKLQAYERVIMLLAIGYADPEGLVAFSHKKDLSQLRTYNELTIL